MVDAPDVVDEAVVFDKAVVFDEEEETVSLDSGVAI